MAGEEDHIALLKTFKEAVSPLLTEQYLADWCDDACCERFLEARDWDLAQSVKMMKNTLAWRIEKRPEITECPQCIEDPFAHSIRLVGFDTEERPVIYTCFGQASGRYNIPGNVIHLCKLLEDTSAIMNKMGVPRWIWVIDFEGFGVYDCSLPMMNQTIQLMDHYPARLSKLIVLDSPWLFSGLWRTVSPLLPAVTKSKIWFSSLKEIDPKLRPLLGDEMADWLKRETSENRDSKRSKGKKYWEWLDATGNPLPHDARGVASFVNGPFYKSPVRDLFCDSLRITATTQKDGKGDEVGKAPTNTEKIEGEGNMNGTETANEGAK